MENQEEIPPAFFMGMTVGFVIGCMVTWAIACLVFHGVKP